MHCFLLLLLQVPFCSLFGNRFFTSVETSFQMSLGCSFILRSQRSQVPKLCFQFYPLPRFYTWQLCCQQLSLTGQNKWTCFSSVFLTEHLSFTVHCSDMWLLLFYVFTILHVFVIYKCLQDSFKLEFVSLSSFSLLFGGAFWEEKYAEVPLLCHLSGNQPLLLETPSFLGFGDPIVFRFLSCLFLLCNMSKFWHPSGDRCLATYSPLLYTFTQAALIHSHDGKYLLYPNNSQFTFPSQISS